MNTEKPMYEWGQIPWRKLEIIVFKLQKRIYRASTRGDIKTVHKLQRLLMKSRAAKLLATRRVTQDNRGRKTAGIDGVKNLTPIKRMQLAQRLTLPKKAQAVRRVWIPKPGKTQKRPLGIPTMQDRAMQALAKLALEPEWEAKFEAHSYGFRPGRCAHDAVKFLFLSLHKQDKYVLDADISKCFDCINHNKLLGKLNTFPLLKRAIKAWLKAGVMDGDKLFPVESGTPQGGVLSPLLANIALHGLEDYIKSAFPREKATGNLKYASWKPTVVRYADDFVILHRDLDELKRAKELAIEWLGTMGLSLNPHKTRIGHTLHPCSGQKPGFDFLGFNFRQYPLGKRDRRLVVVGNYQREAGHKTIITPTKDATSRHKKKLSDIIDKLKTAPQKELIGALNPVIRGWANYYATVNSNETFRAIDNWLFIKLLRWAVRRHPMKSKHWIAAKYWAIDSKGIWEFSDEAKSLLEHRHTKLRMHVNVKDSRSPYDGDWKYWSVRRGKYPGIKPKLAAALKNQIGRCYHCKLYFRPEDIIEIHHADGNRKNNTRSNLQALHGHCHDVIHATRSPSI